MADADADDWSSSKFASAKSRSQEREELARAMAEFEAKFGPVKTQPIVARSNDKGDAPIPRYKPTRTRSPLLGIALAALQEGKSTVAEIAKIHPDIKKNNIYYALSALVRDGQAEQVSRGVYRPLPAAALTVDQEEHAA